MAGIGDLLKIIPGAAVVTASVAGAGVLFVSPYGPFKAKPPVCETGQVCVIVVGLDDDVNVGVGVNGQAMGFDLQDIVTQKVVRWVEASPSHVTVYKMPQEIQIPEHGFSGAAEAEAQAITQARDIGRRYHASLVVIGRVIGDNDESVELSFINPDGDARRLKPAEYEVPRVSAPPTFNQDFETALARARGVAVAETATPTLSAETTTATTVDGAVQSTPAALSGVPNSPPQVSLTSDQRAQLERMIGQLMDGYQGQMGGSYAAPSNFQDEIVPLQPGGQDQWSVALAGGTAYRIIGACDAECNNVDIELVDPQRTVVASDVLPDDIPIVDFTPTASGQYVVRTILRTCTLAPCFVGARVLVRGAPGADKRK